MFVFEMFYQIVISCSVSEMSFCHKCQLMSQMPLVFSTNEIKSHPTFFLTRYPDSPGNAPDYESKMGC